MMTLIDTAMPSEEDLERVLNEQALGQQSEPQYIGAYLKNVGIQLSNNPASYRSFGPWWPEIKRLLAENLNNQDFGESIDLDVQAIYSLTRPALTLVAAHLYRAERIDSGYIYSAYHELAVHDDADDTEPYLYVSADEDMEKLIAIRG